jgi:hypothetical protein
MVHSLNLYNLNIITMTEPDLFAIKPGAFNRSPDLTGRDNENYDVQSITKKI